MKNLAKRPLFLILGIYFIANGLFFIFNDNYFKWPPSLVPFENDDLFGGAFILIGIGIFAAKIFDELKRFEPYIFGAASILQMFLAVIEFMHMLKLGLSMPWIPNLCIALMIPVLASRSDVK